MTAPAGTTVRSYLVHFDSVGGATGNQTASITFDRQILGVIVTSTTLDAVDPVVGDLATSYPPAGSERHDRHRPGADPRRALSRRAG